MPWPVSCVDPRMGRGSVVIASTVAALALACMTVACSVADIPGGAAASTETAPQTAAKPNPDGTGQGSCVATQATPVAKQDPSKLEACACNRGGKARCVTSGLPESLSKELETCGEGGRCVPDTVLTTGDLRSCHSSKKVVGKQIGDGRCVSLCVPKVAENASLLDRGDGDACADDERCVPCVNPADGKSSGLCELKAETVAQPASSCEGETKTETPPSTETPSTDPPSGSACCGGKGACVSRTSVRPEAQMNFGDGEGDCDMGELCMPTTKAPTKCSASPLGGKYSGVCLSQCLVGMLSTNIFEIDQGSCGDAETCVPCTMHGMPTNAPGCS
jgi:hypothetical protein